MNNNQFNGGYPQQPYQPPQPQYQQYPPQPTPQQIQMQQQQYMKQLQINSARSAEKSQILTAGIAIGAALIANLVVQIFWVVVVQALGLMDIYNTSFLFQHAFNIFVVDFCGLVIPFFIVYLLLRKRYVTPLVPTKKVGFLEGAAWVFLGLAVCFVGNLLTQGVIELFKIAGYELTQPETLKPSNAIDCLVMLFSTAVAPAVCEEFAMRCSSLGALRRHGKAFAVVAVSIMFGLMHANVIQFVFAFTIALILGYVTVKTDSVVPAMFIHGLNNGLSVLQDSLKIITSENTASTIATVLMIGFFVLGIAALIYLAATHKLLPKKEVQQPKPYKISFGTKILLLAPGLFIPFVILIAMTSQFVTKI